jgi:Adenylosuccinate synthase
MPITVIVGGQYGSEGKGKVAYCLAKEKSATIAIRVGGSNSGHTVLDSNGERYVFRHLPTPVLLPGTICILPAGSYLDLNVLFKEIQQIGLSPQRLLIDPNAVIITKHDSNEETTGNLRESIGSTLSGTGSAVVKRILRNKDCLLAKDEPLLKEYIQPVVPFMRRKIEQGERIILEGTQGFGLSVLHASTYPYVTSRDTTAAAFVSEAGLSPLDVDEVILTLRTFPIRVGGNSGPLSNEITWEIISKNSGSKENIQEYTSVTNRLRRVAAFDAEIVNQAIMVNKPTDIVLNHLDYVDHECRNIDAPTDIARRFISDIEAKIGLSIKYYGFGPSSLTSKTGLRQWAMNIK